MFRILSDYSVMCRFYHINFSEYMIARKTLVVYVYLFFPNGYQRNEGKLSTFKANMAKKT